MGSARMVVHLSCQETECRRHHERPLAEVWEELLHQVTAHPCKIIILNNDIEDLKSTTSSSKEFLSSCSYFNGLM